MKGAGPLAPPPGAEEPGVAPPAGGVAPPVGGVAPPAGGVAPPAGGDNGVGFGAGGGVEGDDCGGALVMVLSGAGGLGASNTPFAPPPAGVNLLPPRSPPAAPPGFAPPIGGAMPGGAAGGVAPPREGEVTAFCGPGAVVAGSALPGVELPGPL